MPVQSNKEISMKIQINSMLDYLINKHKYSYTDAFLTVVSSNTYHRLLNNDMYMNQGTSYVLDDFKQELGK